MKNFLKRCLIPFIGALMLVVLVPGLTAAERHVVQRGDLHQALMDSSQTRMENIQQLEQFFATDVAQQALRSVGLEPGKIGRAMAQLDDDELARLATRTAQIQDDFAAGEISDRTMLIVLIVVGVGTLIALLIAMP